MAGTITLPHTCPHCNKTIAKNHQQLEELFGFRNMKKGATNQSWCRKCRGE